MRIFPTVTVGFCIVLYMVIIIKDGKGNKGSQQFYVFCHHLVR